MSYNSIKEELKNITSICKETLSENHTSYVVDILNEYDPFLSSQLYCGICGIFENKFLIGDGINIIESFKFNTEEDSIEYFYKYFKLNNDYTQPEGLIEELNDNNSSSLFIPLLFFEKTLIFVFTKDRSAFEQHFNISNIKSFFTDFPVLTELLKWCATKYKTEDSFMEEWNKDMVYSDNYPQDNYLITQSIFKQLEYPYLNTINTLSGLCYENIENNGVIEFSEDFEFEVSNKIEIEFTENENFWFPEIRKVRKLLQVSNSNFHLVLCSSHPYMQAAISDDQYWYIKGYGIINKNNPTISFLGNNKWIWESKNEIIKYDGLLYRFESKYNSKEKSFEIYLKEYYTHLDKNCNTKVSSKIQKSINTIIELANKQKHGTMLIFSEKAKEEAERLCKLKRGFLINPINLFDLYSNDKKKCKEILLQLTSIDGAVMLTEDGICYAIGVIVDGIAYIDSDSSRGARYNSGKTYIKNCIDKNIRCFAAIISEDKTIDILG